MYNIYKDQKKIGQTEEKTFVVDGLEPDTEYVLGVSKVEGDKESAVIEVKARTEKEVTEPEPQEPETGEVEGASDVSSYHVGGGYYEIDGERVRGKEEASKLLNKGDA